MSEDTRVTAVTPVLPQVDIYTYSATTQGYTLAKSGSGVKLANSSDANPNTIAANDTFSAGGKNHVYTYVGGVTYGNGLIGFVATNSSQQMFLMVPYQQSVPSSGVAQPYSPNSSQDWSLTSNSFLCFVAGTLIATPTGPTPVESLVAGDLVLTAEGQAMPVRWLGRSTVSRVFADPLRVLPIRIRAGALDVNVPVRDLLVSPGHGVRIGGLLANAGALVNGTSILREHDMPEVFTYYHVELDTHAVLLAEGAPVESYLDGVESLSFANLDERTPPAGAQQLPYPRAKAQRQLPPAVRAQLAARAAALGMPAAAAA